jgi:hypothetical protein
MIVVRWRNRGIGRENGKQDASRVLQAVLLLVEETPEKPGQKALGMLSWIRESDISNARQRARFWRETDEMLDRLAFDADRRREIIKEMAKVIPRP